MKNVLLLGFYSTVGDLEVLEYTKRVLSSCSANYECGSVHWDTAAALGISHVSDLDPKWFTHVLIVCGPVWPEYLQSPNIQKFSRCSFGGINLSVLGFDNIEETPFDYLRYRDWGENSRVDLSHFIRLPIRPLVGVILAPSQNEYGSRQRHESIAARINEFGCLKRFALIDLDTRWPKGRNSSGIGSPEDFESALQKMDAIITTRLHGLVLSHKHGIPTIAIDPIQGGDKVLAQAKALGVDCFTAERLPSSMEMADLLSQHLSHFPKCVDTQRIDESSVVFQEVRNEIQEFISGHGGRADSFFACANTSENMPRKITVRRVTRGILRRSARLLEKAAQSLD